MMASPYDLLTLKGTYLVDLLTYSSEPQKTSDLSNFSIVLFVKIMLLTANSYLFRIFFNNFKVFLEALENL